MLHIAVNEVLCALILFRLRWGEKFACRCGCTRASQLSGQPKVFVCHRCRRHHSVTAGTVLHGCKVPLVNVFAAAAMLCRPNGVSAREVARRLGMRVETAWKLCHRLRGGLASVDTPLEGQITVSDIAIALRDVQDSAQLAIPARRRKTRHYPVLLVATDEKGRVRAAASNDPWFRPNELAGREHRYHARHPVAAWMATVLHGQHHRVSPTWLSWYLGGLAALQSLRVDGHTHLGTVRAMLVAGLARPTRGFEAARPPKNRADPSFAPDARRPPTVRLDLLEHPIRPGARVLLDEGGWLTAPDG